MPLPEAEKRRSGRESSADADDSNRRDVDESDRPRGVTVVAVVLVASAVSDLLGGFALAAGALGVLGVPVAALGAMKCWAALGLVRFRARALGFSLLFVGVGAMLSVGELLFVFGSGGGGVAAPAGALVLDAVVVGYLIVVADEFE